MRKIVLILLISSLSPVVQAFNFKNLLLALTVTSSWGSDWGSDHSHEPRCDAPLAKPETVPPAVAYLRHAQSLANERNEVGGLALAENDYLSVRGQIQADNMGKEFAQGILNYFESHGILKSQSIKIIGFTSEYRRTHQTYKRASLACQKELSDAGFTNVDMVTSQENELLNEQNLKRLHGLGAGVNPYGVYSCLVNNDFSAALDCGVISTLKSSFGRDCQSDFDLECPDDLKKRAKRTNDFIQESLRSLQEQDPYTVHVPMVVTHENLLRALKEITDFSADMGCGGTRRASKQGKVFASHCPTTVAD